MFRGLVTTVSVTINVEAAGRRWLRVLPSRSTLPLPVGALTARVAGLAGAGHATLNRTQPWQPWRRNVGRDSPLSPPTVPSWGTVGVGCAWPAGSFFHRPVDELFDVRIAIPVAVAAGSPAIARIESPARLRGRSPTRSDPSSVALSSTRLIVARSRQADAVWKHVPAAARGRCAAILLLWTVFVCGRGGPSDRRIL